MKTLAYVSLGVAATAVTFLSSANPMWFGISVSGLAAVGVWQFGKCHHPRPLGLLPPVVLADGHRQPAQWFCERCGRSWPAMLERSTAPIPRFQGHDEGKAREAARRASAYEARMRDLAVQRAGMAKPAGARRTPGPVPIGTRRAS